MADGKISDIKFKQLDRDPEIKKTTNAMERMILGEAGVGLFSALGITPGKVQKHLDEADAGQRSWVI